MSLPPLSGFAVVVLVSCAVAAAALTWLSCRWWYRRQVASIMLRLRAGEQSRSMLVEQAQQMRRQIESVTKTLEAERGQAARLDASRRRARDLEATLRLSERAARREPLDLALSVPMPLDAPADFADTQFLD